MRTWEEVANKDVNDLDLKLSEAADRHKWMEMIRLKWNNINNTESDALS